MGIEVEDLIEVAEKAASKPVDYRPKMAHTRVCAPCRSESAKTKVQVERWRCRSCRIMVCQHNSTDKAGDDATCWPCIRVRSMKIVIK